MRRLRSSVATKGPKYVSMVRSLSLLGSVYVSPPIPSADRIGQRNALSGGHLAVSHGQQVERDAASLGCELWHDIPPLERVQREAVEEERGVTGAPFRVRDLAGCAREAPVGLAGLQLVVLRGRCDDVARVGPVRPPARAHSSRPWWDGSGAWSRLGVAATR